MGLERLKHGPSKSSIYRIRIIWKIGGENLFGELSANKDCDGEWLAGRQLPSLDPGAIEDLLLLLKDLLEEFDGTQPIVRKQHIN